MYIICTRVYTNHIYRNKHVCMQMYYVYIHMSYVYTYTHGFSCMKVTNRKWNWERSGLAKHIQMPLASCNPNYSFLTHCNLTFVYHIFPQSVLANVHSSLFHSHGICQDSPWHLPKPPWQQSTHLSTPVGTRRPAMGPSDNVARNPTHAAALHWITPG